MEDEKEEEKRGRGRRKKDREEKMKFKERKKKKIERKEARKEELEEQEGKEEQMKLGRRGLGTFCWYFGEKGVEYEQNTFYEFLKDLIRLLKEKLCSFHRLVVEN